MRRLFLADKKQQNADTLAEPSFFLYDKTTKNIYREEYIMRHRYIRNVLALVWVMTAIVCGVNENPGMAALYGVIGLIFLYSACSGRKKDDRGEK